jgi:hypothetical protein
MLPPAEDPLHRFDYPATSIAAVAMAFPNFRFRFAAAIDGKGPVGVHFFLELALLVTHLGEQGNGRRRARISPMNISSSVRH